MRLKKYPRYTKLFIQWTDIMSDPAWNSKEQIDKAQTMTVSTVGFFLQNKNRELKIAHSISDDASSDYTVIPWSIITSIVELVEVN